MFKLKVVTVHEEYGNFDVDRLSILTSDGVITMLSNHMDYITPVENGVMTLKFKDSTTRFAVSKGLFTFKDNQASLLVDTIEAEDKIDVERAERAKKRAEERILRKESHDEIERGELALKRSLVRLLLKEGK